MVLAHPIRIIKQWGFPKPIQGTKRLGDQREELEGEAVTNKKEKAPKGAGIFNPRLVVLTDSEKFVLGKGLKYAPQRRLNIFQTYMDIHKFIRRLSIKRFQILFRIIEESLLNSATQGFPMPRCLTHQEL